MRSLVAADTMAFHFERPRNFLFKAGQFVDLILPSARKDETEQATHAFSIASSPFAQELVVVTRMRNTAFKRALSDLAIGAPVRVKAAMGSFTLHKNISRPAIFLAGGIGIVPFLSMLREVAANRTQMPIYLFYANRFLKDAAFIDALKGLESSLSKFTFVPTLTRSDEVDGGWEGETGRISREMLLRHVSSLREAICYVAGPAGMVSGARLVLNAAGIDDDDIRTEEFAGY